MQGGEARLELREREGDGLLQAGGGTGPSQRAWTGWAAREKGQRGRTR